MSEHSVAIVSFEGALKREIKRVREYLKRDDNLSGFRIDIEVSGRVHDGDVDLVYKLSDSSYNSTGSVSGDSLQAIMDEFMRRRGWEKVHTPKAIGYEKIPSDDTDEIPI